MLLAYINRTTAGLRQALSEQAQGEVGSGISCEGKRWLLVDQVQHFPDIYSLDNLTLPDSACQGKKSPANQKLPKDNTETPERPVT